MTACKWAGSENGRLLPGRHEEGCPGTYDPPGFHCPGCLPCPEPHCVVCRKAHADVTCPECIAATRDDLRTIAELCHALPTETIHRGVNSEAAMLWGPTADPEAWGNRAMSAMMGRTHAAYLDDCRDEKHPLWVLGTWEQAYRDAFDQPTDLTATLPRIVDYLDRQLHRAAGTEEPPFDAFARDLRACRAHVQAVLHDQNQGDRANVGCFDCGGTLERKLTPRIPTSTNPSHDRGGFEDHWTCGQCRRRYTYAEYNFALRATLEAAAMREDA